MKVMWRCLKCGECCRHMTGCRYGLALLPEEVRHLSIYARRHRISFQARPLTSDGIRTTLYQMTQEKCPFLSGNRCLVYPIRPLACQAHPLHPSGIAECEFLKKYAPKEHVTFPPDLLAAGTRYMRVIMPRIRSSLVTFDLNGHREWYVTRMPHYENLR